MTRTLLPVSAVAFAMAVVLACSKQPAGPLSPSLPNPALSADASVDGSTLKASAPAPQSPISGQKPDGVQLTLVVANAETKFVAGIPLTYRFEILSGSNIVYAAGGVAAGAAGTTSHTVSSSVALTADAPYQWRARAECDSLVGPWSSPASFVAPASKGYIRGNELYDLLVNGETVGTIHGPVTFVPGVGIKLEHQTGFVSYELPETLTEGEFSILVTNLRTNTEGNKTKLFSMAQGWADIVTNERRMTVEKRGDPAGVIAWRFITHGDHVDTIGNERVARAFNPSLDYFWQATWRNNFFNLRIVEGGVNGTEIYSFGKHFVGRAYDPKPHMVFLGAPVGRSGVDGASVDGVIIRQVWVSGRPRLAFADK